MLDIPICVYASAGISRVLGSSRPSMNWSVLVRGKILPLFSVMLVISAAIYIVVPAQHAMLYYAAFPSFLPTSMIQDSVPLSDMASLKVALDWVAIQMGPGDVLITHQAIYGWARAYLPSTNRIISYGYSDPLDGVSIAESSGCSTIWAVWWTPGVGWHGQAYLPTGFASMFLVGNMAVYKYQ